MNRSMLRNAVIESAMIVSLACAVPTWAAARVADHRHHARHHRHAAPYGGYGYGRRPYASSVSPTITCYYPDGMPYDPDIIGGPNHVGDGGPAANLGGFYPCAF